MTSLALTTSSAASLKVDAVVVGVVPGRKGLALAPGAQDVADAVGKGFLAGLQGLGATGGAEQVVRLATLGAVKPAVVVAASPLSLIHI